MKENSNVSGQTDVDAMRDNSQTSSSTNDDPNIGEDDEKSEQESIREVKWLCCSF